jgi:hypothetical protein
VVQVATPGLPLVTFVVPHPVFELHATVPVTAGGFAALPLTRPFTCPFSPVIVAVNVTDSPNVDGLRLEVTTVAAVA